jgi:shikimate kinase
MGRALRAATGVRRVVLVGFMASGKSTVGERLARELGWSFVDVDRRIEERAGSTVAEIFRAEGEGAFRALEARTTRAALAEPERVVATGGGWPAAEGRMDRLAADPHTLTVWLRVAPAEAVRRATAQGPGRPLLAGEDPHGVARRLLDRREEHYQKAGLHLDTGRHTPEELVARIVIAVEGGPSGTAESSRTSPS